MRFLMGCIFVVFSQLAIADDAYFSGIKAKPETKEATFTTKPKQKCFWLSLYTTSYHYHAKESQYNENNDGTGLEYCVSENNRLAVGVYRNSLFHTSRYVVDAYQPFEFNVLDQPVKFGVLAGFVSGYIKDDRNKFHIAGAPLFSTEWKRFGLNLIFVPPFNDVPGVVVLQVKIRINDL